MERLAQIATFFHCTSCRSAMNCVPILFHGREPKNCDVRFSKKIMNAVAVNSELVNALQDARIQNSGKTVKNYQQLILSTKRIMTKTHQQSLFQKDPSIYF